MKKRINVWLGLMLALTLVFSMTVFAAAASKSELVEITKVVDADGNAVGFTVSDVGDADIQFNAAIALKAAHEAGELDDVENSKELTVLWCRDIKADKLPVDITFTAEGVKAPTILLAYHWNGSKWELVAQSEAPEVTAHFDDLSPVGLVSYTPEAEVPGETTPGEVTPGDDDGGDVAPSDTGDHSHIYLWGALMAAAGAGAAGLFFYGKKRREI